MTSCNPQRILCVRNDGYAASLHQGRVYQVVPDPKAEGHGMLRVVDATGEDYLYPGNLFLPVNSPKGADTE